MAQGYNIRATHEKPTLASPLTIQYRFLHDPGPDKHSSLTKSISPTNTAKRPVLRQSRSLG